MNWVLAGKAGEEERQPGRLWGRCSRGCRGWEAQGSQRRAGAGTRHSGRTRWAAVAGEGWARQEGSRLPQSGRSTQRRWRGPQGTRIGGGSEGGARGRWSGDCDTAIEINRSVRGRKRTKGKMEKKETKGKEMKDEKF